MAKAAKGNGKKAASKSEIFAAIAESTGLTKKQVASVFDALSAQIAAAISKKGPGVFQLPGLCKITVRSIPASKERVGINRFTGQEQVFKAKPASLRVKVRPLKALKDMVN